ncbi:MAG: GSCFA domain-containing protein [Rhodospirillaceae bacterium]|nr:GSCFA domain-containing protein [Rhodospirillaceae bacterium]
MAYLSAFPRALITPESAAIKRVIEKTIIGTYAPAEPFISRATKIASVGSCFAAEISNVMRGSGFQVVEVPMAETSNSAFALDQYLSLFTGQSVSSGFLGDAKLEKNLTQQTISEFLSADVYIITFGMSLCWFNSNHEFIAAPPQVFENLPSTSIIKSDAGYYMRQTTVEENEEAIQRCIDKIKSVRPNATIIMTLSPVPLAGTRYSIPAVPANTLSKAVLRTALESVKNREAANIFYWPSYEIVTWFGCHVERSFGEDDKDARHVREKVFKIIGNLFVELYMEKEVAALAPKP